MEKQQFSCSPLLVGEGLGERFQQHRKDLTPPTPLPYEGRGEKEKMEKQKMEKQQFSCSPLLAGEGLGERSNQPAFHPPKPPTVPTRLPETAHPGVIQQNWCQCAVTA